MEIWAGPSSIVSPVSPLARAIAVVMPIRQKAASSLIVSISHILMHSFYDFLIRNDIKK